MKRSDILITALVLLASSPLFGQQKPRNTAAAKPAEDSQLYRNASLGFRYQIPYGWVDRTRNMQEGSDGTKGEVLLAVFEHPPEITEDGVNSAAVIATEDAASYPGLRTAADYLGPLNEVTSARGFKAAADPSEITIDGRSLIRVDFTRPLATSSASSPSAPATTPAASSNDKLTMRQSTLVLVAKGKIVSFTFLADTSDGVDQLIERLNFGVGHPVSKTSPRH